MKYTLLLCERSRKIVGSRKIVVPREREKSDAQEKHAKNQQPEGSHRHHQ